MKVIAVSRVVARVSRLAAGIGMLAWLAAAAQAPVAIEREPAHHLRFENDSVRVFEVDLAPGAGTLAHSHGNEGVSIRLSDARISDSVEGLEPRIAVVKTGDVAYLLAPQNFAHSVRNVGETPFRNLFIEFKGAIEAHGTSAPAADTPGRTLVLDNDRVQVYRLVLPPGATTGLHTHALKGLGVAVRAGRVVVEVPGKEPRAVDFTPGQFQWRDGGLQHALRNVGTTEFEAVDVELKGW